MHAKIIETSFRKMKKILWFFSVMIQFKTFMFHLETF